MPDIPEFSKNVTEAREVALALLKPSPKEIAHGMELHQNSLVVESYSLGLHAPIEPEPLNQLVEEQASPLEFQDLWEEHRMLGWLRSEELKQEYRDSWEASGVNCIFLNAGEEGNDPRILLKRFARYVALTDHFPEVVKRVRTVNAIRQLPQEGKRGLCLTLNGIPLTREERNTHDELRYIRVFAQLGAKMMHLTYNRRNAIGDGCGERVDAGLSDFGQEAVKEMNRLGVIIDLAHTGWQTCIDAAKQSSQPVVASHSVAWGLNPHIRGKTDKVIRAIVETGGTIGVTNVPRFLGRTGDIVALLDHIDYIVKKFGVESVTIGTDRPHQSVATESAQAKLIGRIPSRMRWEALWPKGSMEDTGGDSAQQIKSMTWTNWPLFTVGLVQRGYSDEDIQKIIGGNLLRVASSVWKES